MKSRRAKISIAIILGIVATFFAVFIGLRVFVPAANVIPRPQALGIYDWFHNTDETVVTLIVDGQEFHVPRNYLFKRGTWKGGRVGYFTLHVLLPELAPYSAATRAEFDDRTSRNRMHIDIGARKNRLGLDEIYQGIRNSKFDEKRAQSDVPGMVMYASLIATKENQYFKLESGRVVYMLSCHPEGSAPNPLCRARFDKSNVVVEYDFSLVHLPHYLNIDKAVKSLLGDLTK